MVRTTVVLGERERAALVALAAERGQRGFSALVQEAVQAYLDRQGRSGDAIERLLALRGSVGGQAGARLARSAAQARRSWDR
ncbi:MAG: hypothetical protein HY744_26425 [Deltaproteobacteria bacterium]|nr:hypothetical protein [Deltaproteobacteria bacterium]